MSPQIQKKTPEETAKDEARDAVIGECQAYLRGVAFVFKAERKNDTVQARKTSMQIAFYFTAASNLLDALRKGSEQTYSLEETLRALDLENDEPDGGGL